MLELPKYSMDDTRRCSSVEVGLEDLPSCDSYLAYKETCVLPIQLISSPHTTTRSQQVMPYGTHLLNGINPVEIHYDGDSKCVINSLLSSYNSSVYPFTHFIL